jgi:hypothetical protein
MTCNPPPRQQHEPSFFDRGNNRIGTPLEMVKRASSTFFFQTNLPWEGTTLYAYDTVMAVGFGTCQSIQMMQQPQKTTSSSSSSSSAIDYAWEEKEDDQTSTKATTKMLHSIDPMDPWTSAQDGEMATMETLPTTTTTTSCSSTDHNIHGSDQSLDPKWMFGEEAVGHQGSKPEDNMNPKSIMQSKQSSKDTRTFSSFSKHSSKWHWKQQQGSYGKTIHEE